MHAHSRRTNMPLRKPRQGKIWHCEFRLDKSSPRFDRIRTSTQGKDRMRSLTLYDKIWNAHIVKTYDNGDVLLYIDRHLVQEVSSPQAFAGLIESGRELRRSDAHIAVADHAVPTRFRDVPRPDGQAAQQISRLRSNAARFGIAYIPIDGRRHGIVHVIGPELGFTLPGATLVCGDSHTSTHGAFGSIAFGIGSSECECIFATQTLRQRKQKSMRVTLNGQTWRWRRGQGHHPRADRQDRCERWRRSRRRIRRPGDRDTFDGSPHDALQHVDRGGQPGWHGGAGPNNI